MSFNLGPTAYPLRIVAGKPYWFITDLENTSTSGLKSRLASADSWELARFNGSDWVRNKIEFGAENPNPGQPIANLNWWNESGKKVVNWWGIPERTVNADYNINADLFVFSEGEVILAPNWVMSAFWGWHYPDDGSERFKVLSILTWNWDDGNEVFLTRYNRVQGVWELIWTVSLGADTINLASNFFANPSGTEARGVAVYSYPTATSSYEQHYQWSEPKIDENTNEFNNWAGRETIINLDTGVVTTGYDDGDHVIVWEERWLTEGFGHQRYPDGAKYFRYKIPVTSDDSAILIDDTASWVEVGDEYLLSATGSGTSDELVRTMPATLFNPNNIGWVRIDNVTNFPLVDVTWILSPGLNVLFDFPEGALNWSINDTGKINIDGIRSQTDTLEGEYILAVDYTREGKVRRAILEYYEFNTLSHIYECFHNMVLEDEEKVNGLYYTFTSNQEGDFKLRIETEGEPDILIQLHSGTADSLTERVVLNYSPKEVSAQQRISGWEWNPGVWPDERDLEDIPNVELPSDIIKDIAYETDYTRHGCTLTTESLGSTQRTIYHVDFIYLDLRELVFVIHSYGETGTSSSSYIPSTEYSRLDYSIGSFTQGDSHRRLSNIFMKNNVEREFHVSDSIDSKTTQGRYINFNPDYKEVGNNSNSLDEAVEGAQLINQNGPILGEKLFNGIVLDWRYSEPTIYGYGGFLNSTFWPGDIDPLLYYSTAVSPNAAMTDMSIQGSLPTVFKHVATVNPSDPLTPAQVFDEDHSNPNHIVRPIFFGYRKS